MRTGFKPSLAVLSNFFPPTAWGYDLWRKQALSLLSGRRFSLQEELDAMSKAVQVAPGHTFADLGTSTGLYARELLRQGASTVYGIDVSPSMLKQAQRKTPHSGFVPVLANASRLPLANQSLDGVVVGGSWNEFAHPHQVAQEMYRVLKTGGRYWVMFSHASQSPLQSLFAKSGLHFPQLSEVILSLQQAGLEAQGWREKSVAFVFGTKVL